MTHSGRYEITPSLTQKENLIMCTPARSLLLFSILFISQAAIHSQQTAAPGASTQPAAPGAFTVILSDEAPYFTPKRLRIPRGSTVKWENRGPALVHTIVVSTANGVLH